MSRETPAGLSADDRRYVVLLHVDANEGSHYDLMVETAAGSGDLMTFRVPAWPVTSGVEVRRLRDHRRLYLTYEGPISGDRGVVHRVDEGRARVHVSPRRVLLSTDRGLRLRLDLLGDDRWWCVTDAQSERA